MTFILGNYGIYAVAAAIYSTLGDMKQVQMYSQQYQEATQVEATQENASDGIYLGTAGIAYMFYQISKNPIFENQKTHLLNVAIHYMKPELSIAKYSTKYPADIPSFILGNGGIYAVAAAIYSTLGDMEQGHSYSQQYQEGAQICNAPSFLNNGSDELFDGRAGYIMGALWITKEIKIIINKDEIWDICSVIVSSGREYSKANKSASPLMYSYYQIEYLGAALM
ncbi:lanC-like protein 3 [Aethina tumida]|uniref:lanC-like protein 3 n=1 Tax=Aethina tumida TaxID=116153 RepID=UPI002148464F|nr:lanC-like protein 3 [Aethina tumida]